MEAAAHTSIYQGKVLFKSVFSKDEVYTFVKKALELTDEKAEITVDISEDKHYWNRRVKEEDFPDWGKIYYSDFSDFDDECLKICVDTEDAEIVAKLAGSVSDCIDIKFSDIHMVQIFKDKCHKRPKYSIYIRLSKNSA